jgi:hypothetical protein
MHPRNKPVRRTRHKTSHNEMLRGGCVAEARSLLYYPLTTILLVAVLVSMLAAERSNRKA